MACRASDAGARHQFAVHVQRRTSVRCRRGALGLRCEVQYEGQAAVELEMLAEDPCGGVLVRRGQRPRAHGGGDPAASSEGSSMTCVRGRASAGQSPPGSIRRWQRSFARCVVASRADEPETSRPKWRCVSKHPAVGHGHRTSSGRRVHGLYDIDWCHPTMAGFAWDRRRWPMRS